MWDTSFLRKHPVLKGTLHQYCKTKLGVVSTSCSDINMVAMSGKYLLFWNNINPSVRHNEAVLLDEFQSPNERKMQLCVANLYIPNKDIKWEPNCKFDISRHCHGTFCQCHQLYNPKPLALSPISFNFQGI